MDLEAARSFTLSLPYVLETMQWGDNLVFWAGDKALGGKMFALAPLDGGDLVLSFAAGPERYPELLEQPGFRPAPYLARAHWVAAERWSVLRNDEWRQALHTAHQVVWNKLPLKTQKLLSLPVRQQQELLTAAGAKDKSPTGKAHKAPAPVSASAAVKQTAPRPRRRP